MNIEDMASMAAEVAAVMKTLSHPMRLLILCQLAEQERSVGEIAEAVRMREAAVSQQLGLIRREGMVTARRDGQSIYYSLARDDIRAVLGFLHQTYCEPPAVAA